MQYRIIAAETHHPSALAAIEIAAAQTFPGADLPEPLRTTFTAQSVFLQAQACGLVWAAVLAHERATGLTRRVAMGLTLDP